MGGRIVAWAQIPANAALLSLTSFWAGLVGLVLTLVGLGLTFQQARRAVGAAQAARDASNAAQARVLAYDVVSELARLAASLKELSRHIQAANWVAVVSTCGEAGISVVRLSELPSRLTAEHRTQLNGIGQQLHALARRVGSTVTKGNNPPDVARTLSSVTEWQLEVERATLFVGRAF